MILTPRKGSQPTIQALVEKFKQSAIDYYSACDDEKFAKQKTVVARAKRIVQDLDAIGVEGRLALIPQLDDAHQGIRVLSAAYLLKVIPDQAIAVLKEIRQGRTIFPRLTAGEFLDSYAEGIRGK
jgi:hypothetical protein